MLSKLCCDCGVEIWIVKHGRGKEKRSQRQFISSVGRCEPIEMIHVLSVY